LRPRVLAGRPGLVVAGGFGPAPLRQGRPARPMREWRAGEIGPMRLFPRVPLGLVQRRRHGLGLQQPTVPAGRYLGSLGEAVIDHPATLESKRRIDLAAARAVIAIAELIGADELAIEFRPHLGSERLAVPPGEKAQQESLHRFIAASPFVWPCRA